MLSRSSDRIKEEHSRSRTHSGLGPVCLVNDLVAIARTVAASVLMTGALVQPSSTSKTSDCSRSFAQIKTKSSHASEVATVPHSSVHQAWPSSEPASWPSSHTSANDFAHDLIHDPTRKQFLLAFFLRQPIQTLSRFTIFYLTRASRRSRITL